MLRVLVVGDMHVVPDELGDCSAVIQHLVSVAQAHDVREVWFMGDQHHTHALVRLEVLNWWRSVFEALRNVGIQSLCLVGNHDQASPGSAMNVMSMYKNLPGVKVVDLPIVRDGLLFVPYVHDEAEFLGICSRFSQTHTVICHQTFDGSKYENGFLASDGFDPNLVPQSMVISGHIHTGQEFGKVWYVGAPRWRNLNDANVARAIWLLEFEHGKLASRRPFSTGEVCRQIIHLEDTEAEPLKVDLNPQHQYRIDIRGSAAYCQTRKLELRRAGAKIRTFPDQASTIGRVRESEGISKAFSAFLSGYDAKHGTSREHLAAMAKERLAGV